MYVRFSGSAGNLNPVALNITNHLCLTQFSYCIVAVAAADAAVVDICM